MSHPSDFPGDETVGQRPADPVALLWQSFLSTLPDDARILDVGGRLAPLAAGSPFASGQSWSIDATLAQGMPDGDPSPRQIADAPCRVILHPATRVVQLPFAGDAFDAIASLDVLEDDEAAAGFRELFRAARPGAVGQMTFRHLDAELSVAARWPLFEAEFLFNEARTLERLRDLVKLQGGQRTELENATRDLLASIAQSKLALKQARAAGAGHLLAGALEDVEGILRAYAPERSDDCVREVDQVRDRILRALHEPESIHAAVRSEDQILALVAAAKAAGFAGVEYNPVMDDEGKPAAWLLLFERA